MAAIVIQKRLPSSNRPEDSLFSTHAVHTQNEYISSGASADEQN